MTCSPCKIDTALSNKLANVGLICACFVVCMHVHPVLELGSVNWWLHRLVSANGMASVAVPMFFCISGFLFAGRMNEVGWWKRQFKKRVYSLLIPYLVWNLIHLVVVLFLAWSNKVIGSTFAAGNLLGSTSRTFVELVGLNPLAYPEYGFLWFLRCLLVMVLISPLFRVFCLNIKVAGWGGGVVVLLILKTVIPCFLPTFDSKVPLWNILDWLNGFFYFPLGIFLRYHPMRLSMRSKHIVLCVCCLLWFLLFRLSWSTDVFRLLGCAVVWLVVSDNPWPRSLTACAFPIFICHGFILLFKPSFVKQWSFLDCTFAGYLIQVLCVLGMCFGMIKILRCCLPKFYTVAFGGRGS